jgi:two-component system NtrC family sensor kinase
MRFFESRRSADARVTLAGARFEDALECAPDAVIGLTAKGVIVRLNAAARTLFGTRLIGSTFRSVVSAESAAVVHEQLVRVAAHGSPQRFDVELRARDGASRVIAVAVSRAPQQDGEATLIATARDVTSERLALADLVKSELRYRQLFEASSEAILTIDSLGRFTTVNGAAERISGFSHAELIGKFFGPLLAIEAMPRALLEFRRALSGAAGQFETVMLHKSGERRHLTVNYACPAKGREVICLIRDATTEKQLQEQLIQAEKMGAIGQLVSGVAHELNNPLASISAFAQLLLADARLSEDQRHSADVMRAEAARASRIVHNLLTFARQHRAEKSAANINDVVHNTLELRRYELNVRGIQVVCELVEEPPITMVDVHQVQQVILNLVTNAEQAMESVARPRHQLTLRTVLVDDFVRIQVEDTGPGIPGSAMNQIFNPFFTTKPIGKGTGLGLSISLGIVSQHGGRMWAENVAHGARFTVELPMVACDTGTAPLRVVSGTARPRAASALRVLVADDEDALRTALDRFLSAAGHSVVTVGSGSEAIWRAEGDEQFDVVLLDLRMPDVSGREVFERWQEERPELSDRVIFLSGDIVSTELQAFLRGTGRPFIAKPFEFSAILEALPVRRVA